MRYNPYIKLPSNPSINDLCKFLEITHYDGNKSILSNNIINHLHNPINSDHIVKLLYDQVTLFDNYDYIEDPLVLMFLVHEKITRVDKTIYNIFDNLKNLKPQNALFVDVMKKIIQ